MKNMLYKSKLIICLAFYIIIFIGIGISLSADLSVAVPKSQSKLSPIGVMGPRNALMIFTVSESTKKYLNTTYRPPDNIEGVDYYQVRSWEDISRIALKSNEDLEKAMANLTQRVNDLEDRVSVLEER